GRRGVRLVLRISGDGAGGARELEMVRPTQPRYRPARLALGTTLFMLGRRDEAVHEWEAVIAQEPAHKAARLYLRMAREPQPAVEAVPIPIPTSPSETTLNDIPDGYHDGGQPSSS